MLQDFKLLLANLKCNNKAQILKLTELAKLAINVDLSPRKIVDAIIYDDTKDKLLILYTLDALMKYVGGVFVGSISERIVRLFEKTFDGSNNETREKLFKMRHTWLGILSDSTLLKIDKVVNAIDEAWPIVEVSNS